MIALKEFSSTKIEKYVKGTSFFHQVKIVSLPPARTFVKNPLISCTLSSHLTTVISNFREILQERI